MNCTDAQKVWGHPDGFLAGLRATYPQVLPRLERVAGGLVRGETNPSFATIQRKVGLTSHPFYVEHASDNDPVAEQVHDVVGDVAAKGEIEAYFSEMFGMRIIFGNLCCKGCKASAGPLSREELLAIQNAAVRTADDGSDIAL